MKCAKKFLTIGYVGVFAMMLAIQPFANGAVAEAQIGSGYGGDAVSCTVVATPDTIAADGGTMISWDFFGPVASATLHSTGSTSWGNILPVGEGVSNEFWISGITDTRSYTISVVGQDGQTADCDVVITVGAGDGDGDGDGDVDTTPVCELDANPATISSTNGNTTLEWTTSDNVVSVMLHPTGSTSWSQDVDLNGTWYMSGITSSRSYSITAVTADGTETTCDIALTVEQSTDGDDDSDDDTSTTTAECVDWDGDGWGWNGTAGCLMSDTTDDTSTTTAECVDWDGDGWGWNGTVGCRMTEEEAGCVDWDGDGWGWNGTAGCLMDGADAGSTYSAAVADDTDTSTSTDTDTSTSTQDDTSSTTTASATRSVSAGRRSIAYSAYIAPSASSVETGVVTATDPEGVRAVGQVLGVATFRFNTDLNYGMRNSDVTELQARLTAEGFYNGPVTGFFGPLTHAAVIRYQSAHNIQPNIGFVGVLTRASLNGDTASQMQVASAIGGADLSGQIQSQIDVLLQMIRNIQSSVLTQ